MNWVLEHLPVESKEDLIGFLASGNLFYDAVLLP